MPGHRSKHTRKWDAPGTARVVVPGLNRVLIGERVQELRRTRGWTGKELARATGIPHGSIGAIESGRMLPDTARLLALAVVLDVSIDFIVRGEPLPPSAAIGDGGANGERHES